MTGYLGDESGWNYADAYLQRIDKLFQTSTFCKMTLNYKGWFESLLALHDELAAQMTGKDEEKTSNEFRDKIQPLVLTMGRNNVDPYIIRKMLSDWEIHMRKVMRSRNMDLPRRADPSKAFLGGN
jgi:hypothetical protein